jgi:two-component system alkaline phosphatase synthesis response regulator PhoP
MRRHDETSRTFVRQPAVLVVDDEESFVAPLAHTLAREGYRVLTAHDGPAALDLVAREQPDVVLLDLMLPGLSGLQVCRSIRKLNIPQPGVIMVTAKGTDVDAVVGLESGADDYVAKPFSLSLLLARVRALLRRIQPMELRDSAAPLEVAGIAHSEPPLVLGSLVIEPDAYEAKFKGRPLGLSPRPFELLLYLARNAGRVIGRDELLDEVWGRDYDGEVRTVDVHIHWLREQLAAAGCKHNILQTVRGVGYKLAPPAGTPQQ